MSNKTISNIINEEIKNFDFLNNGEFLKEQDGIDLLSNEDLQKQFICDSLLNKNEKIKIIQITDSVLKGNWDEPNSDDANRLSIEYYLNIEYRYDIEKNPLKFNLNFNGDNVGIAVDNINDIGNYDAPPNNESWFKYILWNDINVGIYTVDGDEIEFIAFNNAPSNIQTLFIREYVENFIENKSSMDVKEKINKSSISQYC